MIVMIVIGWAVALPLVVVLGLLCASKVLGRRTRAAGPSGATDMTAFAHQFPMVHDSASIAATDGASQSVSAGY
jgi:hypothetical protein